MPKIYLPAIIQPIPEMSATEETNNRKKFKKNIQNIEYSKL